MEQKSLVLRAEAEFIGASFGSKVPLLALYWYTVSNTEYSTDKFTVEALAIVISAIVVALTGVGYFCCKRGDKNNVDNLRFYHALAGAALFAISLSMFIFVGISTDIRPNATVVTTFSIWQNVSDSYIISPRDEQLGGLLQLAFFPPTFAMISAVQHLYSWQFLRDDSLFDTYGGAWLPRIVDYAFSTPFIFLTNAWFFDSPLNIFTVLLTFSTYGMLMFLGYATEVAWYHGLPRTAVLSPFLAGCVGFILSWVPIFVEIDKAARWNKVRGGKGPPFFVFVFVAWVIVSFCFFPAVTWRKIRHANGDASTLSGAGYSRLRD